MVPYFQEIKKNKEKENKNKNKKNDKTKRNIPEKQFSVIVFTVSVHYFIHLLLLTFFRLLFNIELPNSTEFRY